MRLPANGLEGNARLYGGRRVWRRERGGLGMERLVMTWRNCLRR